MSKSIVSLIMLTLTVWIGLPYLFFACLGSLIYGFENMIASYAIAALVLIPSATWFWWLYHTYVRKKR